MSTVRKYFSLEAANFSLFSQEGEVTSPLKSGPAWILRLQFTKYQQRYAPIIIIFFFFFFFFFLQFQLQFISGALNYAGASLCATSYFLPRAYNAPLGGALVFLCKMTFASLKVVAKCISLNISVVHKYGMVREKLK